MWAVAGVLLAGVALAFVDLDGVSRAGLLIGAIGVAGVLFVHERARLPTVPTWLGHTIDVVLVVLILLAVPNLFPLASGVPGTSLDLSLIQFHQNFYLGPANQILAGDAMLVDVLSQYGVGSIYFLAGAFAVIPISNGTLGLVEGLLSALMFVGTFVTLRFAGVSRLVAATTMAVAVTVLVYGLEYPLGALLQHGAIRFGLPIGVVVGAVAEARWPRAATPARLLQLVTVAVAAVWALEAFAYTLLTVLVIAGVPGGDCGRRASAAASWAAGRPSSPAPSWSRTCSWPPARSPPPGSCPDWGWYLNTLRQFLFGRSRRLDLRLLVVLTGPGGGSRCTWPAGPHSPVIVMRRPDLVREERPLLIGIAGMTGYGIALYTYIVNRAADHIIPYVSLPASALGRPVAHARRAAPSSMSRPPAAGSRLGSALAVSVAARGDGMVDRRGPLPAVGARARRARGESLAAARERLWNPAPDPARGGGGSGPARRAPARGVAQHRAHQRRPLGRDPDASRARQRGPARRSLGGQLRPRAAPRPRSQEFVDGLAGGERMLLDAPAAPSLRRPSRAARLSTRWPSPVRGSSSQAPWPRCRSGS